MLSVTQSCDGRLERRVAFQEMVEAEALQEGLDRWLRTADPHFAAGLLHQLRGNDQSPHARARHEMHARQAHDQFRPAFASTSDQDVVEVSCGMAIHGARNADDHNSIDGLD